LFSSVFLSLNATLSMYEIGPLPTERYPWLMVPQSGIGTHPGLLAKRSLWPGEHLRGRRMLGPLDVVQRLCGRR
jgi:hypothetical protein